MDGSAHVSTDERIQVSVNSRSEAGTTNKVGSEKKMAE